MRPRIAAVLAALVVAGCGDDGPTKDDFAARADAVCREGNRALAPLDDQVADVQRDSDQRKVFAAMARLTRRSVTMSARYVDRLDALETPAGDRDRLKGWIADVRRQLTLIGELGDAFAAHDQAAIVRLSEQIDALNTRNNRFAASYGMRECARRA
ncbi:MAG TPA: hypothetical protein VFZ89_09065 [Solirubrobacteraceae bacterium]